MVLKVETHIDIKGEEGRRISGEISNIIEQFILRNQIEKLKKIQVYVTKDPIKVCRKIVPFRVKLKIHGEMREWICENAPSFSYYDKNKGSTIMLSANQTIFKKRNHAAIKGLFAHELMHLLDKLDGIDEKLQEETEMVGKNIFFYLEKHKPVKPFTKDRLLVSFLRVMSTISMLIKDVLANTRAMSFGYDMDIYKNYEATLTGIKNLVNFNEKNIIKALKKDKKHVLDDAFLTYLGLNVSWIPFKMFHNMLYKKLQDMAYIQVPRIIKKNSEPILNEMLKLRSAADKRQITKILRLSGQNYFNIVQYFCKRLR